MLQYQLYEILVIFFFFLHVRIRREKWVIKIKEFELVTFLKKKKN
jgi:hypothetical protein